MTRKIFVCGLDTLRCADGVPWMDFVADAFYSIADSTLCHVHRAALDAPELPAPARAALSSASILFVVCSVQTMASVEMEAIARSFRGRLIVALIVSGEGPVQKGAGFERAKVIDARDAAQSEAVRNALLALLQKTDEPDMLEGSAAEPVFRGAVLNPPPDTAPLPAATDLVTFAAFAPAHLSIGEPFVFDVWAHTAAQSDWVAMQARELGRESKVGVKAGAKVARDSVLGVVLEIATLRIANPADSILWQGEPANASFIVEVPSDSVCGRHSGRATITVGGIPITYLVFTLNISAAPTAAAPAPTPVFLEERPVHTAFASYSTRDRAEVLARVQGMSAIRPNLNIFLDVISLRAGQHWEDQIKKRIQSDDIFLLFWSEHAAASSEVKKEWKLALEARGIGYINPVPLCDPAVAKPPEELNALHFNDFYLAQIKPASHQPSAKRWWKLW